jgi:hypothetical protein
MLIFFFVCLKYNSFYTCQFLLFWWRIFAKWFVIWKLFLYHLALLFYNITKLYFIALFFITLSYTCLLAIRRASARQAALPYLVSYICTSLRCWQQGYKLIQIGAIWRLERVVLKKLQWDLKWWWDQYLWESLILETRSSIFVMWKTKSITGYASLALLIFPLCYNPAKVQITEEALNRTNFFLPCANFPFLVYVYWRWQIVTPLFVHLMWMVYQFFPTLVCARK